MVGFFLDSEKLAGGGAQSGKSTLRQLMASMRQDDALRSSLEGQHKAERVKNVMDSAMDEVVRYASQYSISSDQLEERMYEMVDTCCENIPVTKVSTLQN